jgi:hypothetical protein
MYEIYLNVNDLSLNCCLQTGYLSIRPLGDFRPLGTLRGTLPTIHYALTTNLASGLETNPPGRRGFSADLDARLRRRVAIKTVYFAN